jgi:hypothetical protein
VAIILAVLLVAALVVIAMITTELTDFSFSLFWDRPSYATLRDFR